MNRHSRTWIVGVVAATGLTGSAVRTEAQVTLFAQIVNRAQVPETVLLEAQNEVVQIYKRIDVDVVWSDGDQARVIVSVVPEAASLRLKDAPPLSLGVSMRLEHKPGRRSYVFYEAIDRMALLRGVDKKWILAAAIAHEMGHQLLPDRNHSTNGVMRAGWDKEDARRATCGLLQFTARQGELIRAGLLAAQEIEPPNSATPTPQGVQFVSWKVGIDEDSPHTDRE